MKKITISIGGYGGEYTVGSLTTEQAFYWLEKDDDELCEHITDPDPDFIENEAWVGYWHDKDDVIHSYGASENNLRIRINFGEEEHVYENLTEFEDIFEMNEVYFENLEECAYLVCYAGEKGVFWEGEIEVEDDVVFNIDDFTIMTNDLFGERFVTSIQYKGEELEDGGAGTTGKSFEYRITYPSDELDN
jgi:hypothetical protein